MEKEFEKEFKKKYIYCNSWDFFILTPIAGKYKIPFPKLILPIDASKFFKKIFKKIFKLFWIFSL